MRTANEIAEIKHHILTAIGHSETFKVYGHVKAYVELRGLGQPFAAKIRAMRHESIIENP